MPCCCSDCHIAAAFVVFAQATKAASAFELFSCCAYGVRSAAPNGDRIFETLWPLPPKIDCTAATLPAPNAVSSAKTTIFLPVDLGGQMVAAPSPTFCVCPPGPEGGRSGP